LIAFLLFVEFEKVWFSAWIFCSSCGHRVAQLVSIALLEKGVLVRVHTINKIITAGLLICERRTRGYANLLTLSEVA